MIFNYKSYTGQVNYDDEVRIFHGEVIDTRDVIIFQEKSVEEIKQAFCESIDDYPEFCKERGERPDKSFSGKFVLRITPQLHHKIFLKASRSGKSLNRWVVDTLDSEN